MGVTTLTLLQAAASVISLARIPLRNDSIGYARNWSTFIAGLCQHGCHPLARLVAVDPFGFPGAHHDSGSAAATLVYRFGFVPVHICRGAASCPAGGQRQGAVPVGDGARTPRSPPGLGHSDSAAGRLRLAAGPGTVPLAAFDLPQPADVGWLWRGSGADAGRVRAVARSGAGSLLV